MGALSVWHWAIVLIALVLLFGSKRLPDAARGIGRSLRIFKSEIKEMSDDGKAPAAPQAAVPVQLPAAVTPPVEAAPVAAPQPVAQPIVTPPVAAPQTAPAPSPESSGS